MPRPPERRAADQRDAAPLGLCQLWVPPFDQDLELAAQEPARALLGHLVHHGVEPVEPVRLHQVRDLVVPLGRGRPGARGERRGVDPVEADLSHEPRRRLELLLRLAREPDDGVPRDARVGHVPPDRVRDAPVPRGRVPSGHLPQDLVVAALERHVEELAQLGQLGAGPDQPLGEVARVRRREADALDARDVVDVAEQVGEGPGAAAAAVGGGSGEVAAVGVDVLSEERHFLVAGLAVVGCFCCVFFCCVCFY